MAVLEVDFDGNIEDLQNQLDDADLETEATVQGRADGPAAGGQEDDGGLISTTARGAIVGAILTVAGLLTPIKEILEGIRNFFLLTLAPVFTALRPLISTIQDLLIGFNRFLAGDITINDILSNIVDAIKQVVNQLAGSIDSSLGFVNIGTPFPEVGQQSGEQQQRNRRGQRTGEGQGRDPLETLGLLNPVTGIPIAIDNYVADRTDEAQKDRQSNSKTSNQNDQYGGLTDAFGLVNQ